VSTSAVQRRHSANTHAVDLNTGGIVCGHKYVDLVPTDSPYLTCFVCCRFLRRMGVDISDDATRRRWPKAYLVTGLRVVRDSEA
jgi:hypothetical protein